MKKILLLLSLSILSFSSIIAATVSGNLNPFAYDLKSTYDEVNKKLTFEFKLNANATRIVVVVTDHNGTEYVIEDYGPVARTDDHPYYCEALLGDKIPMGRDFTWRVDVYGEAHSEALFVSNENKLYEPTSIDIDNNPENANFGTVFCIEGRGDGRYDNKYISHYDANGAGLYIFNADGTPRPLPRKKNPNDSFGVSVERYGWNGGTGKNDPGSFGKKTGYAVYRVRVADDGRIFITSMTPDGEVLYEANKNVFSDTVGTYWAERNWKRVISVKNNNGNLNNILHYYTAEWNYDPCGHTGTAWQYCNIYNLYSSTDKFVAGPNIGFDVRGAGENLQLLMLSGCKQAIEASTPEHYYCSEYNLGTNVVWQKAPSAYVFKGYVSAHNTTQVQYDKNGNVWLCQYRSSVDQYPTLMKFIRNADGTVTPVEIDDPRVSHRRCGAIRFNKDFTKFAVVSPGTSKEGGTISIYPVGEDGNPDFANGTDVFVADKAGLSMMDLAWDYADNLYIAADRASYGSNNYIDNGRCIAIYAMPRENNMVSTPAASKYAFSTRYHVKWDNLFVHEQDVEDGVINKSDDLKYGYDFSNVNYRLWKLIQVGFNQYRTRTTSKEKVGDLENWATNNNDVPVTEFFNNNKNGTITDDEVVGFFDNDAKFSWLRDYLSEVSGEILDTRNELVANLDAFINREGDFAEKGKADYWRPLFVKNVLGLDDRVLFDEGMPIHWQWTKADEEYFTSLWVPNWHTYNHTYEWLKTHGYHYAVAPSDWYYFNTIRNLKSEDRENGGMGYTGLSDLLHILAWRDGGVEGNIVHNVNRDNMVLHATYVAKNIDEDDLNPSRPLNFDASNDDVMRLMLNKNFGADGEHTFTISRRLQAGMYNTICLPFNLDLKALPTAKPEDSHPLSGAIAMEFTGVENGTTETGESLTVLQFTEVTQLQAGVPYLIDVQEDIANDMEFWQVPKAKMILPSDAQSVTRGGITFHGTINPTEIPAQSLIVVANNRLALTTMAGGMAGMRGYFSIDPAYAQEIAEQAANGRVYLNFQKPSTTSIPVAPEAEQSTKLNVEKLIIDGHLYILRGEEVYTITGSRVR